MGGGDGVTFGVPTLVIYGGLAAVIYHCALQHCSWAADAYGFVHIVSRAFVASINGETWVHFHGQTGLVTSLNDLILSSGVRYGDISHIILAFDAVFGADDLISIADDG